MCVCVCDGGGSEYAARTLLLCGIRVLKMLSGSQMCCSNRPKLLTAD